MQTQKGTAINMQIIRADSSHIPAAAELALLLWPGHTAAELEGEFCEMLSARNAENAIFLAYDGEKAAAFAQCGLRHDYVEGTESSPVGYLEGIFVREEYRGQKIASALLQQCMDWSREYGCTEFASDCELTNAQSLQFHLHSGFTEANRIICFVRKLPPSGE